jgi:formate dehydrogenase iron-sulfur subunit
MRFREIEDDDGNLDKWAFVKIQCMHCLHPACEAACIVGALRRSESTGAVVYDKGKCIGCRYCMVACPFGIPCYQWGDPSPWIKKCTFCSSRQKAGENPDSETTWVNEESLEPACVTTCPTDALVFGKREDLLEEAKRRIAASPGRYYDHVYGENEVGGTSWMYINSVSPDGLDMPQVSDEPVPRNARKAMGTLPYYAMGVIGLMAAIYWVTKRRQKATAGAGEKKEG